MGNCLKLSARMERLASKREAPLIMILAKLCRVSDSPSQGDALSLIGQDGKCDSHLGKCSVDREAAIRYEVFIISLWLTNAAPQTAGMVRLTFACVPLRAFAEQPLPPLPQYAPLPNSSSRRQQI